MTKRNIGYSVTKAILVGSIGGAMSVVLYGIIRHERILTWEFGWHVSPYDAIGCYYLLPTLFIISMIGVLHHSYRVQTHVALLIVSCIGAIFAGEAGFIIFASPLPSLRKGATLTEIQQYVETTTTLHVAELRDQEIQAYRLFAPGSFLNRADLLFSIAGRSIYSLSGITHVPTVFCNEGQGWVTYHSDEYGFHNPYGLWSPQKVDIIAIGDSFTQGVCVPSEDNLVALIRANYPRTINLGMSGSGPLAELGIFREYAEPLSPKVILWIYCSANDLSQDLENEKQNPILLYYLDAMYRQDVSSWRPQIDDYLKRLTDEWIGNEQKHMEAYRMERRRHLLTDFLLLRTLRLKLNLTFIPPLPPGEGWQQQIRSAAEYDFPLYRQILSLVSESVSRSGGHLYFVYLPVYHFFSDTEAPAQEDHEKVCDLVTRLHISLIDLYPIMRSQPDPLIFFPNRRVGHYNEWGYQLVADTILDVLKRDPLIAHSR